MRQRRTQGVVLAAFLAGMASTTNAQTKPWDLLFDQFSNSRCDVVNAVSTGGDGVTFRTELVVLSTSGQLVLVGGADTFVPLTFANLNFDVFNDNLPFGSLTFADDGDDLRSLWWTTATGTIVHVDSLTAQPSVSSFFPSDFVNVSCDACPFWDDQSVCATTGGDGDVVIDFPPITISLCGVSSAMMMAVSTLALGFTRFRRRHVRSLSRFPMSQRHQ